MVRRVCLLLPLLWPFWLGAQETLSKSELWKAAREGDIQQVRTYLDRGWDVDTEFRYKTTALFYACDRGHVELVRLLLERGADPNRRDDFYRATPMTWALSPPSEPADRTAHDKIVVLLLEHGSQEVSQAFFEAVPRGAVEIVEAALATATLSPIDLSVALWVAEDTGQPGLAVRFREAGAVPPPALDAEALARYTGTFQSERGQRFVVKLEEGKLRGSIEGQPPLELLPVAPDVFVPVRFPGLQVQFNRQDGVVTTLVLGQGGNTQSYEKVEE